MNRILTFILAALTLTAASSCTFIKVNPNAFAKMDSERVAGSSNLGSRSYTVPQFTGIDLSLSADIVYTTTAGEPSVTVEAPDNLLSNLNFKVDDGVLKVRFDDDRRYSYNTMRIKVSSATLESINIRGAGEFNAPSGIDCRSMDIDINGAGEVDLDGLRCEGDLSIVIRGAGDIDVDGLSCKGVTVEMNGAGDVDLSGRADSADLTINGAGDIDISELAVDNVSSSVSGVGKVKRK